MPWGEYSVARSAKYTGSESMIALYPRADSASRMAVQGGESPDDLHLTLVYLGSQGSAPPDSLLSSVGQLSQSYTVITAEVMGHAVFNPTGPQPAALMPQQRPQDQCAVYLVGDASQLDSLRHEALRYADLSLSVPPQHNPMIPHITAGYAMDPGRLSFTGQILFDRIGVAFAGNTHYFPLLGATISPYST